MDHEAKGGANILGARPNGQDRAGAPALTSRLAQMKSFNPRRISGENVRPTTDSLSRGSFARSLSSGSSSDNKPTTGQLASRIPAPSPSPQTAKMAHTRKTLSLSEAYRMAREEEEEAARGSPSPAPRSWRLNGDRDLHEGRMQRMLANGPLSRGGRYNTRVSTGQAGDSASVSSVGSSTSRSHKSDESESDMDRKMMQYEEDQVRMNDIKGGKAATLSKPRTGSKGVEAGSRLPRKMSSTSLNGGTPSKSPAKSPRTWGSRGKYTAGLLERAMSSPTKKDGVQASIRSDLTSSDSPLPSMEKEVALLSPKVAPEVHRSPNKSFAWQADEDFTAGDLQVSDSPRINVDRATDPLARLGPRPINSRLQEIRQLEIEAAQRFPDEPLEVAEDDRVEDASGKPENERSFEKNQLVGRTNTKLDELRALEEEGQSRRALASARLDEIRQRNAEFRSPSPEFVRNSPRVINTPDATPGPSKSINQAKNTPDDEGERIPNTPITIFRKSYTGKPTKNARNSPSPHDSAHSHEDSHELLRRLARATSRSPPVTESRSPPPVLSDEAHDAEHVEEEHDKVSVVPSSNKDDAPPVPRDAKEARATVGLAGLRRSDSTLSASTKRSSMAQSDGDPIDRIEAEMRLFAPMDNQSERGSIRAPSLPPSDSEEDDQDEVEETPRPSRTTDPLSLPTPKVTGAFIETPATGKTDKDVLGMASRLNLQKPIPSVAVASFLRGRRGRSDDMKSDSGLKEIRRAASAAAPRRRARSVPRTSSPLKNSAQPASVRDDLREIVRMNEFEDSTLEDFDELLAPYYTKSSEAETEQEQAPDTAGIKTEKAADNQSPIARIDRHLKLLNGGLLSIREVKKGIDRLQDGFDIHQANGEPLHLKGAATLQGVKHEEHVDCPHCMEHKMMKTATPAARPATAAPYLYYREPKFKLTLLGILVALFAAWLAAEVSTCSYYCRPRYCLPHQKCRWSPDDPSFGLAIPTKLDQWIFDGQGQVYVGQLYEGAEDLWADAQDYIKGVNISAVDPRTLSAEARQQWRRRLRRKGLAQPWTESADQKEKLESWRQVRKAQERAREAREMGYDTDALFRDESMADDEQVQRSGWGLF